MKITKIYVGTCRSALIGQSNDQTFNIYNGENGSNGKSKFVEFMGYVFGDYKGTVPIVLITSTDNYRFNFIRNCSIKRY